MLRFAEMFPAACILALSAAGCGGGAASVSGTVTYEGEPVGNGAISFLPVDGVGPIAGAQIVKGEYHIRNIAPGEKIVEIAGYPEIDFPATSEEAAQRAAEALQRGGIEEGSQVTTNLDEAEGNHATVEIQRGRQTIDLHLTAPPR